MNFFRWLMLELENLNIAENSAELERRIYVTYKRITIVTGIAITLGYGLNYWGFGIANAVIGILLMIGMISVAVKYNRTVFVGITAVSLIDAFRSKTKADKNIRDNLLIAAGSRYMLYTSLYFLFASVHSFKFSPGGALIAVMAFICLAWMDVAWKYDPRIFKPFAFAYCVAVIIWAVATLIQPVTYVGWCGKDLASFLRPYSGNDELNELIMEANNAEKNQIKAELKSALDSFKANPTPANMKKVTDAQEKLSNISATGKLFSWGTKKEEPKSIAPPAQSAQQVVVKAPTTPDGVKQLSSGFHYINPESGRTQYWVVIEGGRHIQFYNNSNKYTVVLEDGRRFNMWSEEDKARFRNMSCLNQKFYIETQNLITTNHEGKPFKVAIEVS